MNKIKVCHICSADLWAGAEVQMYSLLSCLVEDQDFEISAVLLNDGLLAEKLKTLGISVSLINENKHNTLSIVRKLLYHLKQKKPDIVHTHKYKESVLGTLAAKLTHNPYVIRTLHGLPEPLTKRFDASKAVLYDRIDRLVCRLLVNTIIAVSYNIKETSGSLNDGKKMICIHNGIDPNKIVSSVAPRILRKELGLEDKGIIIGTGGRLTPVKGVEYLLKAAQQIKEKSLNVIFLVAGEGPQRHQLEELAKKLDIQSHVIFTGHRSDIYNILNMMDIFVMPSLHEGIPMILLEAMCLSKVIVASRVGGIPEVLEEGESGVFVNPGDSMELATCLVKIIANFEEAKHLGHNAKVRVEAQFSEKTMAEKTSSLYKAVVSNAYKQ